MTTLSGSPNDTKTLDMVLKELKRRRIIKPFDKIIAGRGYPSLENCKILINKCKTYQYYFQRKQPTYYKKNNITTLNNCIKQDPNKRTAHQQQQTKPKQ